MQMDGEDEGIFKGVAVIPFYGYVTNRITCILQPQSIRTVTTTFQKIKSSHEFC